MSSSSMGSIQSNFLRSSMIITIMMSCMSCEHNVSSVIVQIIWDMVNVLQPHLTVYLLSFIFQRQLRHTAFNFYFMQILTCFYTVYSLYFPTVLPEKKTELGHVDWSSKNSHSSIDAVAVVGDASGGGDRVLHDLKWYIWLTHANAAFFLLCLCRSL